MKRFHISIAVADFSASVNDYSKRLECKPCVIQDGRYALWRTDILNFSISCKPDETSGRVRHIGFEDDRAKGFAEEKDVNGLTWEYFNRAGQESEIDDKFPQAVKSYDL
jgi:hypothetical protein